MVDVQHLLPLAARKLADVVGALDMDDWTRPTSCDVSVRELVEHVLAGNEFAVRLLAGATAEEARDGIETIRVGPRPVVALEQSCKEQVRAFLSADPTQILHHPSGDIAFETFVLIRLGELAIHAWDIAIAVGGDPTLDQSLAGGLWELVQQNGAQMQALGTYGVPGRQSAEVDPHHHHQLLAAFGRQEL